MYLAPKFFKYESNIFSIASITKENFEQKPRLMTNAALKRTHYTYEQIILFSNFIPFSQVSKVVSYNYMLIDSLLTYYSIHSMDSIHFILLFITKKKTLIMSHCAS